MLGGVEAALSGSNSMSPPLPPPFGRARSPSQRWSRPRGPPETDVFSRRIKLLRVPDIRRCRRRNHRRGRSPVKARRRSHDTAVRPRVALRTTLHGPRFTIPCTETGQLGAPTDHAISQPATAVVLSRSLDFAISLFIIGPDASRLVHGGAGTRALLALHEQPRRTHLRPRYREPAPSEVVVASPSLDCVSRTCLRVPLGGAADGQRRSPRATSASAPPSASPTATATASPSRRASPASRAASP